MSMKPELILDGVTLPTPAQSGITVTPNRLWSANAGRNTATGKFLGDIIAVKYTVSVTYDHLTDEEMQRIFGLLNTLQPWHTLIFPLAGGTKKITCYAADAAYTMRRFSVREKCAYYDGVTLEFIEQ